MCYNNKYWYYFLMVNVMKKRVCFVSRILQAGSLSAMTLLSSGAEAQIPLVAFKDVGEHFAEGKEFLNPILGAGALESHFIDAIRFDINFTSGQKGNQRVYIDDKSTDPTWNLVKILFPSPAGQLAIETDANTNFSKNVTKPETISHLLNYANAIREKKDNLKILEKETFDKIVSLILSERDIKFKKVLQQKIQEYSESHKKDIENLKELKQQALKNATQKLQETLSKELSEALQNNELQEIKISGDDTKKIIDFLKKNQEQIDVLSIFNNQILKGKDKRNRSPTPILSGFCKGAIQIYRTSTL